MADAGPVRHVRQTQREDRDDEHDEWLQPGYDLTTRAVCKRCNNGWMAQLEHRTKPLLEPMLHGHARVLLRGPQELLATWAVKTAMMTEQAHSPGRRGIPKEEYAFLYEHRKPSERVLVWMASYAGEAAALGRSYGFDADVRQGFDPDSDRRNVWDALVTFGPVAFNVFGTTVPTLLDDLVYRVPGTHQIWPFQDRFTWRGRPGFDDAAAVRWAEGLPSYLRAQVDARTRS